MTTSIEELLDDYEAMAELAHRKVAAIAGRPVGSIRDGAEWLPEIVGDRGTWWDWHCIRCGRRVPYPSRWEVCGVCDWWVSEWEPVVDLEEAIQP